MRTLMTGGGTVKTVTLEKINPENDQARFEAGVQHYSGMIGFAAACGYLREIGMGNVEGHEKSLAGALKEVLQSAGATIYGPDDELHGALHSFNYKNAKPHDLALLLDKKNVAVRSGFFCAQPAMESLGAKQGAVRASGYIYNTLEDIKRLGDALQSVKALYD
jgi:selenocysteine lyase/cysteine desulfurase